MNITTTTTDLAEASARIQSIKDRLDAQAAEFERIYAEGGCPPLSQRNYRTHLWMQWTAAWSAYRRAAV